MKISGFFLAIVFSMTSFGLQTELRALKAGDSHLVFDTNLKYKEVVITFSGNIDPKILDEALEIMAADNVRALFFVTGTSAIAQPEYVYKILTQGHILGSQGMGKQNIASEFSSVQESIANELQTGHELVYSVAGFVFPFVRLSPRHGGVSTRQFIKENGVYAIYWNIDYLAKNPEESIIESLKKENYRGIVSLSLSNKLTIPVLKALIEELKKEDVKVIQIVPPDDGRWGSSPPLVRQSIINRVKTDGSLIQMIIKNKENSI